MAAGRAGPAGRGVLVRDQRHQRPRDHRRGPRRGTAPIVAEQRAASGGPPVAAGGAVAGVGAVAAALAAQAGRLRDWVAARPVRGRLMWACRWPWPGRRSSTGRWCGASREELLAGLAAAGRGEPLPGCWPGRDRGGGGQDGVRVLWAGQPAARDGPGLAAAFPVFAAAGASARGAGRRHLELGSGGGDRGERRAGAGPGGCYRSRRCSRCRWRWRRLVESWGSGRTWWRVIRG